ncbi:unnamed protein product [Calypogeia fissa]
MEAPDIAGIKMPLALMEVVGSVMVDIFLPSKKRYVAQRVESSESNMAGGNSPATLQQHGAPDNAVAEQMEHNGEGQPPNVPIGPDFPRYLQSVVYANKHRNVDKLVEELKTLSPTAYCEEYITSTRPFLTEHAAGLCAYIRWLAIRVEQNQETILNLNDQVEQLSSVEDYDRLVKEKSSWTGSMKQLESELNEEKVAREKAELEREEARATVASNADLIQRHLQELSNANQELESLRKTLRKLEEEKGDLSAKVLQGQVDYIDMETRLGQANDDRDEALQDLENLQGRADSLIQRVTKLEAQFDNLQGPSPSKPIDDNGIA